MTTVDTNQGSVTVAADARGVVWITLERPEARNALSPTLVAALAAALRAAADDESTRVVVLAGAGRAFCAGGDIESIRQIADASFEEIEADARQFAGLYALVASLPVPVVARVQGPALGGGTALASCADFVVAADSAQFGCTEVRLGVIPAVIAPYLRRRVHPSVARRLLLTGERITAVTAQEIGLVDAVVDDSDLDAEVERVLQLLLAGNGAAQRALRPVLGALLGDDSEGLVDVSVDASARFRTSDASKTALAAFLATLGSRAG